MRLFVSNSEAQTLCQMQNLWAAIFGCMCFNRGVGLVNYMKFLGVQWNLFFSNVFTQIYTNTHFINHLFHNMHYVERDNQFNSDLKTKLKIKLQTVFKRTTFIFNSEFLRHIGYEYHICLPNFFII